LEGSCQLKGKQGIPSGGPGLRSAREILLQRLVLCDPSRKPSLSTVSGVHNSLEGRREKNYRSKGTVNGTRAVHNNLLRKEGLRCSALKEGSKKPYGGKEGGRRDSRQEERGLDGEEQFISQGEGGGMLVSLRRKLKYEMRRPTMFQVRRRSRVDLRGGIRVGISRTLHMGKKREK